MSLYSIKAGRTTLEIRESAGTVIHASSNIDWAEGLPFMYVLGYARKKGWTIVPVVEDDRSTQFDFRGVRYVLSWSGDKVNRIMAIKDGEEEEITWQQLPEQLKGLL